MRLSDQGYYNAIVYDVPPNKLFNLFERNGRDYDAELIESATEAVGFINDRMDEEVLVNATRDESNAQELLYRGFVLESIRYSLMGDEWEPHFKPFRFHR